MTYCKPLYFTDRGSRVWELSWAALESDQGARSQCNLHHHFEDWQYMGTVKYGPGRWYSQFRHRAHPEDGRRRYVQYLMPLDAIQADPARVTSRQGAIAL